MDIKERMIELAGKHGKNNLYPYVVGNIKAIVADLYYTAEEKVNEIDETLIALTQVRNDRSLPWDREDAKKAPVGAGTVKEISHLDCTIDLEKVESLMDFPLIELGSLCRYCDCFRCKRLGVCDFKKPTTLVNCKDECNGRMNRNVCEFARKRGFINE